MYGKVWIEEREWRNVVIVMISKLKFLKNEEVKNNCQPKHYTQKTILAVERP